MFDASTQFDFIQETPPPVRRGRGRPRLILSEVEIAEKRSLRKTRRRERDRGRPKVKARKRRLSPEQRVDYTGRERARRQEVKAVGGAQYEAFLQKQAEWRQAHPDYQRKYKAERADFKRNLCSRARNRGRKKGLEATIQPGDLDWPSHCPVLGVELDYPAQGAKRTGLTVQANWPSLDRWDSTKGYVPGNVFVISYRANTLKSSATYAEILRVAKYLSRKPK